MEAIKGRVVFITGASSGIGEGCARAFAAVGGKLLLAARRIDRLVSLKNHLEKEYGSEVHIFELDVRNRSRVEKTIGFLSESWKAIDILINNAGLSRGLDKLQEGSVEDWDEMIDTNVKGLLYVSRVVVPGMVERGRGHVINIGSVAGHEVYPGGNVYCASKHAVKAISKGLKIDLFGTPVRVTSIDPGMVKTEFSIVRFHGDRSRADKVYEGLTPLSPDDIAEAALFCASRPPHVNINEIIIMPTAQASATLAYRK